MGTEGKGPFGDKLRRFREEAGLSQEELAHRAGLTPNAIGTLERGERRRPYPNTVRALADALGLEEPERAELISSVPRRETKPAAATPLPVPPTAIIGREREVQSVEMLFQDEGARLVTLLGPGGVGKTRLVIEVASRMRRNFPDGVVFVDLAPLDDADAVVPAIAQALGLRLTRPPQEALDTFLAPRRLLLTVDNFEHVLGAAVIIASLLESSPHLCVLATSRSPLRIRGEVEFQVGPLEVPETGTIPEAEGVGESPAVQLFLRRAHEVASDLTLTPNNAGTIAAICWRLEGLPLALELVAAQMRFLSPTDLLSRLDSALRSPGPRDLPSRQRTIQATLEWDHDLMSEQERIVFRNLGVFAGGFTLAAAEAFTTGEPIAREHVFALVGQLAEKSLIVTEHAGREGGIRYRLLEPIRQYSLQLLHEGGSAPSIQGRHADYFSALAQQAAPELKDVDQLEWIDRLSEEHDNMRAALGHLLEQGRTEEVAGIGWNLWLFWLLRGHVIEGQRWMENVLDHERRPDTRAFQQALWVLSMFTYMRGDTGKMVLQLEELYAARAHMDEEILMATLMLHGHGLAQLGRPEQAEPLLHEALSLARNRRDRWYEPHALQGLAHVALDRRDVVQAHRLVEEALATAREVGDRWTLGISLTLNAVVELLLGNHDQAEVLLQECAEVSLVLQDTFTTAYSLLGLAVIAARRQDGSRMARLAGAAEALREKSALDISSTIWRSIFEEDERRIRSAMEEGEFERQREVGRHASLRDQIGRALQ